MLLSPNDTGAGGYITYAHWWERFRLEQVHVEAPTALVPSRSIPGTVEANAHIIECPYLGGKV
jgi:hypothetical protein